MRRRLHVGVVSDGSLEPHTMCGIAARPGPNTDPTLTMCQRCLSAKRMKEFGSLAWGFFDGRWQFGPNFTITTWPAVAQQPGDAQP